MSIKPLMFIWLCNSGLKMEQADILVVNSTVMELKLPILQSGTFKDNNLLMELIISAQDLEEKELVHIVKQEFISKLGKNMISNYIIVEEMLKVTMCGL